MLQLSIPFMFSFAKTFSLFFIGHSMVASSVRVPAVFISFAIFSYAHLIGWASEHSSVQSITASLSVDGTTNGSPILKLKVIFLQF